MKKCQQCGFNNPDDYGFCEECGSKLTEVKESKPKAIIENVKKYIRKENMPKIGIAALAVIALIVVLQFTVFATNDVEFVINGVMDVVSNPNLSGTIEAKIDGDADEYGMLSDFSLETNFERKNEGVKSLMSVKIGDESIVKFAMSIADGYMFIDLLDNYDEVLMMQYDEYEEGVKLASNMSNYLSLLNFKGVDKNKYFSAIAEELGRDMKVEDGEIMMIIDDSNFNDLAQAVIKLAKKDDALMKALHESVIAILTQMEDDDFEYQGVDDDDIDDALDTIEDFDDFEEGMDELFDMLEEGFDDLDDSPYKPDFEFTLAAKKTFFGGLQSLRFVADLDEMQVELTYTKTGGPSLANYDKRDAEDIEDMTADEMGEIAINVFKSVSKQIKDNEKLVKAIEDTKFYDALEDEYNIDSVDEIFQIIMREMLFNF